MATIIQTVVVLKTCAICTTLPALTVDSIGVHLLQIQAMETYLPFFDSHDIIDALYTNLLHPAFPLTKTLASPRCSAAFASRFFAHKDPSFSPLLCSFCIPLFRSGKEGERGKFRSSQRPQLLPTALQLLHPAFSLTKTPTSPRCSAASASRFSAHKDPIFSPLLCISLSVLVRLPMTIDRRRKITPPLSLRCAKQNGKYWRCKNWRIRDNPLCQVHFQQLALLKEGKSLPPEKGENKLAGKKPIVSLCCRMDRRRKITPPPLLRCARQNGKHWRCKNWSLHDKPFCQVHFFQQQALIKQGKSLPSNAIAGKKRKKVTFAVELRKSGRLQHEAFSSEDLLHRRNILIRGRASPRCSAASASRFSAHKDPSFSPLLCSFYISLFRSQRPNLLPAALQLLHPAFPLMKGRREREVQELTKTPASPHCSAASASRFSAHKDPSFSPLLCSFCMPLFRSQRPQLLPAALHLSLRPSKAPHDDRQAEEDHSFTVTALCQAELQALLKEGKSLPSEKRENKPAGKKPIVSLCSRLDRRRKITPPPSLRCARQNGKHWRCKNWSHHDKPFCQVHFFQQQALLEQLKFQPSNAIAGKKRKKVTFAVELRKSGRLQHEAFSSEDLLLHRNILIRGRASPRCSAVSVSRFSAHKDPSFSPLLCSFCIPLFRSGKEGERGKFRSSQRPQLLPAALQLLHPAFPLTKTPASPRCSAASASRFSAHKDPSFSPLLCISLAVLVRLPMTIDRRRKITPPPSLRCAKQNGKYWRCKNWRIRDNPLCQVHFQQQALLKEGKSLPPEKGENKPAGKKPIVSLCSRLDRRRKITHPPSLRCARQNGKHWRCKNWSLHDKPFCQVHFFQQQALLKQGKSQPSNAIAGKKQKKVTFAVEMRKSGRLQHQAFSSE
ncbi:hypothetical protein EJ110_NYTH48147 [Nymphaea thermarum]|nr:hypothetical protein EJ110_NYTH48147 [Nymphaea thermarum]